MEGIKFSILICYYSVYIWEEYRVRSWSKAESKIVRLGWIIIPNTKLFIKQTNL